MDYRWIASRKLRTDNCHAVNEIGNYIIFGNFYLKLVIWNNYSCKNLIIALVDYTQFCSIFHKYSFSSCNNENVRIWHLHSYCRCYITFHDWGSQSIFNDLFKSQFYLISPGQWLKLLRALGITVFWVIDIWIILHRKACHQA